MAVALVMPGSSRAAIPGPNRHRAVAGRPRSTSPKPGLLSIKLFVPYCDAICDSPTGTRQFERVTS